MKKRTAISKIMTKDIVAVNKTDDLETVEKLFKQHSIRHMPVISKNVIIGMISYSDLLRISFADAVNEETQEIDTVVYNMFTIDQVMTKNVNTVSSDTTIKEVAEILAKKEFHALPVVDNGELVGIVTTTDLINYLIEQF